LTLTFIGLFFVSLIVVIVADIEVSSFFEDQVNGAINTEVEARASKVSGKVSKGGSVTNTILQELKSSEEKK
jgi:hypothetical protein